MIQHTIYCAQMAGKGEKKCERSYILVVRSGQSLNSVREFLDNGSSR